MRPFLNATPDLFAVRLVDAGTELYPLSTQPEDFVVPTSYRVVAQSESEDDGILLGAFSVKRVLLGQALNTNVLWQDVMAADSDELYALYNLMFEPALDSQHSAEFDNAFRGDGAYDGLDYTEDAEVLDFNWGASMLHTLLQHSTASYFIVAVHDLAVAKESGPLVRAQSRAAVLTRLGFVQLGSSPYFCRNQSYVLPELPTDLRLTR